LVTEGSILMKLRGAETKKTVFLNRKTGIKKALVQLSINYRSKEFEFCHSTCLIRNGFAIENRDRRFLKIFLLKNSYILGSKIRTVGANYDSTVCFFHRYYIKDLPLNTF